MTHPQLPEQPYNIRCGLDRKGRAIVYRDFDRRGPGTRMTVDATSRPNAVRRALEMLRKGLGFRPAPPTYGLKELRKKAVGGAA